MDWITGTLLGNVAIALCVLAVAFVGKGVLVSVVVLGLILAAAFKFNLMISSVLVASFALLHGGAMGAESGGAMVSSVVGLLMASVLIQLGGAWLGKVILKHQSERLMRTSGGVIALLGVVMSMA